MKVGNILLSDLHNIVLVQKGKDLHTGQHMVIDNIRHHTSMSLEQVS